MEKYGLLRKEMMEYGLRNNIPISVTFELTPLCNLNCKMCYVHLMPNQMSENLMGLSFWIRKIKEATDLGMMYATLTGGEFFTYPYWKEIYKYLISLGICVTLKTNALLLNENTIEFLRKYPPYNINISIYGGNNDAYEAVTGFRCFDEFNKNIQNAIKAGLPINFALTVSKAMLPFLKETFCYIKDSHLECGINLSLNQANKNTGRNLSDYGITIDEAKKCIDLKKNIFGTKVKINPNKINSIMSNNIMCGAGKNTCCIGWNGIMHPCTISRGFDIDVKQISFEEGWIYLNKKISEIQSPLECTNCEMSKNGVCKFCPSEHNTEFSRHISINENVCIRKKEIFKYLK